jgi:hypothetical protein
MADVNKVERYSFRQHLAAVLGNLSAAARFLSIPSAHRGSYLPEPAKPEQEFRLKIHERRSQGIRSEAPSTWGKQGKRVMLVTLGSTFSDYVHFILLTRSPQYFSTRPDAHSNATVYVSGLALDTL